MKILYAIVSYVFGPDVGYWLGQPNKQTKNKTKTCKETNSLK